MSRDDVPGKVRQVAQAMRERAGLWWMSREADRHVTLLAILAPLPVTYVVSWALPWPLLAWLVIAIVWGSAVGWLMSACATLRRP